MKLVLIGGGQTRNGLWETKAIDEEAVKMTGKEKPNFLFVGLASSFSDSYYDTMKEKYRELGCECVYLKKKNIINNPDLAKSKIKNADIIYFCGGDTIKLINDITSFELVDSFKEAVNDNTVMVGMSAGAIMMCREGYSDSLKLRGDSDKYEFINGLGFTDIIFSPHHSIEKYNEMITEIDNRVVYSLEDNTALKIIDGNISVIKSDNNKEVYLIDKNSKETIN